MTKIDTAHRETESKTARNPDFDDGLVAWDDQYSGRYEPVAYSKQFDDQWRLYLEGQPGFRDHTGVETAAPYIDDRIYELTGVKGVLERRRLGVLYLLVAAYRGLRHLDSRRDVGGRLYLEPKFPLPTSKGNIASMWAAAPAAGPDPDVIGRQGEVGGCLRACHSLN